MKEDGTGLGVTTEGLSAQMNGLWERPGRPLSCCRFHSISEWSWERTTHTSLYGIGRERSSRVKGQLGQMSGKEA